MKEIVNCSFNLIYLYTIKSFLFKKKLLYILLFCFIYLFIYMLYLI